METATKNIDELKAQTHTDLIERVGQLVLVVVKSRWSPHSNIFRFDDCPVSDHLMLGTIQSGGLQESYSLPVETWFYRDSQDKPVALPNSPAGKQFLPKPFNWLTMPLIPFLSERCEMQLVIGDKAVLDFMTKELYCELETFQRLLIALGRHDTVPKHFLFDGWRSSKIADLRRELASQEREIKKIHQAFLVVNSRKERLLAEAGRFGFTLQDPRADI